jgi:ribosomal protein L37AE/L43A
MLDECYDDFGGDEEMDQCEMCGGSDVLEWRCGFWLCERCRKRFYEEDEEEW